MATDARHEPRGEKARKKKAAGTMEWYEGLSAKEWLAAVGRLVSVSLSDRTTVTGYLYTKDPLLHHIVLLVVPAQPQDVLDEQVRWNG